MSYRLIILLLAFWLFAPDGLKTQTSDQQYRVPLEEVLRRVEERYGVDLFLVHQEGNTYRIKPYRYPEMSPDDGRDFLHYLSGLYSNRAEWEKRKKELRECMFRALDLSPLPPFPGAEPILTKPRKHEGYTIENIALETLPGLYVCGSVYRPEKIRDKIPVILCPNGHFENGRYRPDEQYRCAMLARMGAMVISYDLFAYGESLLQFKPEDHHRSMAMRVQVLNSLRILDYLMSLEYADPERVAITGGSGGGSHTMLITALDDRIRVSVPVVMLSSFFAGGCPCESGLPVHLCGDGTSNPEIAAMAAPRPQLVISDGGDWTRNVPEVEFPYLRRIYGFYGREDLVENVHLPDEGHDYGPSKRQAMYAFMVEHMGLDPGKLRDEQGNFDESACTIEKKEAMLVFGPDGQNLPANAIRDFATLERIFPYHPPEEAGTTGNSCSHSPSDDIRSAGNRNINNQGTRRQTENGHTASRFPRKIAVCDWMILKRQKAGAFDRAKQIGADGLEVDMGGLGQRPTFDNQLLDPVVRKQFLDKSRDLGIQISSIAMSGFYAQSFPTREGIDRILDDCINTMLLMGVKTAFLPLGVEGDLVKYPERREAVVERLRLAGRKAEAAGVVIGIETSLDAAGEVALLKEIGSPAIRIYFNFQNPLKAGRDLCRELEILGRDRICQIHCTDSDGVLLEDNQRLDMMKVKATLDEMGWEGWLVIERSRDARNPGDVIGNFGANTRYLKSIFQ